MVWLMRRNETKLKSEVFTVDSEELETLRWSLPLLGLLLLYIVFVAIKHADIRPVQKNVFLLQSLCLFVLQRYIS